jgi:hypothetical protein
MFYWIFAKRAIPLTIKASVGKGKWEEKKRGKTMISPVPDGTAVVYFDWWTE